MYLGPTYMNMFLKSHRPFGHPLDSPINSDLKVFVSVFLIALYQGCDNSVIIVPVNRTVSYLDIMKRQIA